MFIQAAVSPDKCNGGDNLRINCKRLMDLTHARGTETGANALLIDLDLRNATPASFDVSAFKTPEPAPSTRKG